MKKTVSVWLAAMAMAWSASAAADSQKIDGQNYRVIAETVDCKAGAECSATVKLSVLNGYHVNKDYPAKIKVADSDAVKFAKPDFGKSSGDLEVTKDESQATIKVKFTAAKAGTTEVAGVFKFAVCSEKDCQTASENIKVAVKVK